MECNSMNIDFFIDNCYRVSELITKRYSTSFSLAASLMEKEKRQAIYAVYGFVRLADETVDSLDGFDKAFLLEGLYNDLNYALEYGISTNAIVVAFADTVKKYDIKKEHIHAFMESMKADLFKVDYQSATELSEYIYGSADVVGLMCLKVFCNGENTLYNHLQYPAQKLGSAFQKVNFIRDLKDDLQGLGRNYFPEMANTQFNTQSKTAIEKDIEKDFSEAWIGVTQLPGRCKLAVALAYYYYKSLFNKIMRATPEQVLSGRLRISNLRKYLIIVKVMIKYKLKMI